MNGKTVAAETSGAANWPVDALVALDGLPSVIVSGLSLGSKDTVFGVYRFRLLQTSFFDARGIPAGMATLTSITGVPVFYNETPYTVLSNYNGLQVAVSPGDSAKCDWPAVLTITGVLPETQGPLTDIKTIGFPYWLDNYFGISEFVISQTQTGVVMGALHNNEITVSVTNAQTNLDTVNFSFCSANTAVSFEPKVVTPGSTVQYAFNPSELNGDSRLVFAAYDIVTTETVFVSPVLSYLTNLIWTSGSTSIRVTSDPKTSSASFAIDF
jgi:hypothetical protein